MREDFRWDKGRRIFVQETVDPETGIKTEWIRIVGDALKETRTDRWGGLERRVGTDGKETVWELSDEGERPGSFRQVFADGEKKIGVELAIDGAGPKLMAANYDACGKLDIIGFNVSSEFLGKYKLFFSPEREANGWLVSCFDRNRQKLSEEEVGWGEILKFAGYEYCIKKIVGGRIRVRTGKNPGFTEVEFREQIDNEQISLLLRSDKPEAWEKVFELVLDGTRGVY